jgi:hypothetical protein
VIDGGTMAAAEGAVAAGRRGGATVTAARPLRGRATGHARRVRPTALRARRRPSSAANQSRQALGVEVREEASVGTTVTATVAVVTAVAVVVVVVVVAGVVAAAGGIVRRRETLATSTQSSRRTTASDARRTRVPTANAATSQRTRTANEFFLFRLNELAVRRQSSTR